MSQNYQPKSTVRCVIEDDGAVLLDLRGGSYFSLDEIGVEIWNKLQEGLPLGEIIKHLNRTYGASEAEISNDVESFIANLETRGLIHVNA